VKHASYLQRVSRHLGTTAVLVPSRRFWSTREERAPAITEEVTVAAPARASVRPAASPRALAERVEEKPPRDAEPAALPQVAGEEPAHERIAMDAADPRELPVRGRRAPDTPAASPREASPEEETKEHRSTIVSSAMARLDAISSPTPSPRAIVTPIEPTRHETIAPDSPAPSLAISDTSVTAPLAPRPRETRRPATPEERSVPARGNRAQTPPRRAAGEPYAPSTSEPSVQIGAIEVHVQSPPRPASASTTPPGPLARGFASTFGLRQE
jgi:hypothetical protein